MDFEVRGLDPFVALLARLWRAQSPRANWVFVRPYWSHEASIVRYAAQMTGPGYSISADWAVVALQIVAESAARFDQAYSFSRLSEAQLTELVDAVACDLAVDARERDPLTPTRRPCVSEHDLAQALAVVGDIYSAARHIVANEAVREGWQ